MLPAARSTRWLLVVFALVLAGGIAAGERPTVTAAPDAVDSRVAAPATGGAVMARAAGAAADTATDAADTRMDWWREARFGMFIHWGLYAIPAGEWNGRTDYGEWIRNNAKIPIDIYDQFRTRFNPTKFDPDAWVRLAKLAGMKYIVITTKHHDGFGLFDSAATDWDVMATPYGRDILKQLAASAAREGIRLGFYYSIMDWHHPDYLPRRDWEAASRPAAGADFERYVQFMKAQLKELLTGYGPIAVLWFDGQWERTWTNDRGRDLTTYVRSLQPSIVINNRVGGAGGSFNLPEHQGLLGDFGTPEQEIPATGAPGLDWETCMTMNGNWGFNKADKNFKPTSDLIHKLVDIASKGGNFLLNVGPTADGEIPAESVERLEGLGAWMAVNAPSIHGTEASPFPSLPWGRATMRKLDRDTTRLYLHVFERPADNVLVVPGLLNDVKLARPLAAIRNPYNLAVTRQGDDLRIAIGPPSGRVPPADEVFVLDIAGEPDVTIPPAIDADAPIFVGSADVRITTARRNVELRYTLDGSEPSAASPLVTGPVRVTATSTVRARAFRAGRPVSGVTDASFTLATPRPPVAVAETVPGLKYIAVEGDFSKLPDFDALKAAASGESTGFDLKARTREMQFALRFDGLLSVPATGVYTFYLTSDDGSRLWIGDTLVVDSDGLHGAVERSAPVALERGLHPIRVAMFEQGGGFALDVAWSGPGIRKQRVPASALVRRK